MAQNATRTVQLNGIEAQLNLDPTLQTSVLRALIGTTPLDTEVDTLPIPPKPYWLGLCIRVLKLYRAKLSPRLGECLF